MSKTIIVFTGKCNYEFKSNIHVQLITASVTQVTKEQTRCITMQPLSLSFNDCKYLLSEFITT